MPGDVGRPPFVPQDQDRRTVTALAACGVPPDQICVVIGISEPTLRKYFSQELETAWIIANGRVAKTLLDVALSGKGKEAVTACIFWLKCRAGWTEAGNQPPGKKEIAAELARTAGVGSDWGDDLLGPSARLN